jgi:hypothetical protein
MKFDSRYSATISPIFRVIAIIIGSLMLLVGGSFFIWGLMSAPFEFDGDLKCGISGTFWGLLFLVAGIKGSLPKWMDSGKREKTFENKINEVKATTRKTCLKALGCILLSVFVLILMFLATEVYSIFWWFSIAITILAAYLYYLNFTIILESKGFNPLLAITVIFPILLLVVGVINPKKFKKMNLA